MPALTFDEFTTPGGVPIGPNGIPRVSIGTSSPKSNALTFDEFMPESTGDKALRIGKDVGWSALSGLDKGVAGLAGLPADAVRGGFAGLDWLQSKYQGRPYKEVSAENESRSTLSRAMLDQWGSKAAHENSGLAYDSQTTPGKYAQSAAEFVPSALLGPGGMARNAMALGVVPGLASEAAGQATAGGQYEPYARGAAAVIGGAMGHWATAQNAAQAAVSRAARGASQTQVEDAGRLFDYAQSIGVPITQAEALQHVTGGATNLGNLQRVVEGSGEMRPFMAQRSGQVDAGARSAFDQLGPQSASPSNIGPQAGQAAEGIVGDVRKQINAASKPFYDSAKADLISPAQLRQNRALPGYNNALDTIIEDPQLARYTNGLPENSVIFQDEIKKQLEQSATNAANGITGKQNMQRSAGFGLDAEAVRSAAQQASPDYAAALAIQSGARQNILGPVLSGPIGRLAEKDITTQKAISALFPTNPLPGSEREIGTAVTALANRNQNAARELVRAHAESAFNEAAQRLQSGANEFGGAGFAAVLRGNPQQAENLKAAVTALRGGRTWQGFDNFLNVLEAQGSRQRIGSQTAFNQEVQANLKNGGTVAEALSGLATGGIKLPSQVKQRLDQMRLGANVNEIATLLTDPRAAPLFRQLATAAPTSARAGAVLTRLVYLASEDRRTK